VCNLRTTTKQISS